MRPSSALGWRRSPFLHLLIVGLLLVGCGRADHWTDELLVEGPIVVGDRLAWLNSSVGSVISVRADRAARPDCRQTLDHARAFAAAGDVGLLLGNDGPRTFLQRLPLARGSSSRIRLRADFDRLSVAPDGRTAVAFHALEPPKRPGSPAARNLSEVAVIDLEAAEATQLYLQTGAAAPTEVRFSADGGLAAVLFERALALVDLRDPADFVLVPLKLPGGQPLQILDAILEPGGEYLFLRTAELDEVVAITIVRDGERLGASINFLGPGGATKLKAIALPTGEGFDRKIAALYENQATLFDADGDTFRDVSIFFSGSPTRISRLADGVLFLHGDPSQRGASTTVVAWDQRALPRFELGFGYLPGWLDDRLLLQLGYGFGSTHASLFGAATSSLDLHSILGSAIYALTTNRIGRAYARAGAELAFATLTVDEAYAYSQTDTLLGLQGVLGYGLNLPFDPLGPGDGPRMHLSLETGYEIFPFAARFDDLRRSGPDDVEPKPISSSGTDVGEMKLSGWMLRFSFGLWF